MRKTVNRSWKNWSKKLDNALWAYKTAYKNPMGMSPYKMVYGKACHLPLELEHKASGAVKELNYDFKLDNFARRGAEGQPGGVGRGRREGNMP